LHSDGVLGFDAFTKELKSTICIGWRSYVSIGGISCIDKVGIRWSWKILNTKEKVEDMLGLMVCSQGGQATIAFYSSYAKPYSSFPNPYSVQQPVLQTC